jgi:protein-tyrosine phosphatase
MKKTEKLAALAALLAVLSGCYQEVELDPWQPGDTLPIAGAYNVRDVGGYRTAVGKTVKTGLLYRSGDLNRLFQRDEKLLFNEKGIKMVIDFRSQAEQDENPDKLPGSGIMVKHFAIDDNIVAPYSRVTEERTNGDTVMNDGYAYLGGGTYTYTSGGGTSITHDGSAGGGSIDQYKLFFAELKNANGPVLFHCSAGKDRTGVAAAFLLALLGVDKETIINDYLKSGEYVKDKYYPVVPYIRKSMQSMHEAKATADKLKNDDGTYNEQKLAGFSAQLEQRVIAAVKQSLIDGGMNAEIVNAMDKTALNGILSAAGKDNIDTQVAKQLAQIKQIGQMSYAQIDGLINQTTNGVATLLSVKREFITTALNVASGKNIDSDLWNEVVAGIAATLGLTANDIAALKNKYLK